MNDQRETNPTVILEKTGKSRIQPLTAGSGGQEPPQRPPVAGADPMGEYEDHIPKEPVDETPAPMQDALSMPHHEPKLSNDSKN